MQLQPFPVRAPGGYSVHTTAASASSDRLPQDLYVSGNQVESVRNTPALAQTLVPPGLSQSRIDRICAQTNPVLRNLQITDYYHDVAVGLRDMIGPQGGNNWPAWACWASKHVGEHIRREDLPFLRGTCKVTATLAHYLLPPGLRNIIWGPNDAMDRAHEAIASANKAIFERTTPHFTRFISTFSGDKELDEAKWTKFASHFRPGTYEEGGEEMLWAGFRSYYEAMFEPDPKKKAELVLLGNTHVVYDEQMHAHEEINEALPWYAGRPVTSMSLYLDTPTETLRLGKDLPVRPDGKLFPPLLESLENPELKKAFQAFSRANGLNPAEGTLEGSRCVDYRSLDERMNLIVNVFRTRHDDASLFQAPFSPEQTHLIQKGQVPKGHL